MSERYGECRHCHGMGCDTQFDECGACLGTGFSGDAMERRHDGQNPRPPLPSHNYPYIDPKAHALRAMEAFGKKLSEKKKKE